MAIIGTSAVSLVAFRGQSMRMVIDLTAPISNVVIGYGVSVNSATIGYISSIDLFGNSMLITPYMPSDIIGYIPYGSELEIIEN